MLWLARVETEFAAVPHQCTADPANDGEDFLYGVDCVKADAAYPGCPCVSMLGDGPLAQRRAVRTRGTMMCLLGLARSL